MAKRIVMLSFSQEAIREPIICNFGQHFNLTTNIRRADISEDKGWAVVELEGEEKDIEQGIDWATSKGVRVDPVTEDIAEG